ncbi:hypothetical protein SKAU_G00256200 [Synaphobranchus kaupii]|uniref:Uncharacterized protein n=1 Tax=Synaphobranchus kaupii TaxID=118154 RepID=A0A9Q1F3T7_SYNKA|nr:hypothetical protein SKAU_G00256200 [Synaphobranchus kaupii]
MYSYLNIQFQALSREKPAFHFRVEDLDPASKRDSSSRLITATEKRQASQAEAPPPRTTYVTDRKELKKKKRGERESNEVPRERGSVAFRPGFIPV